MIAFQMAFVLRLPLLWSDPSQWRGKSHEIPGKWNAKLFTQDMQADREDAYGWSLGCKDEHLGQGTGNSEQRSGSDFFLGGETSNILLNFTPILGKDPIWLLIFSIFFKCRVETTNYNSCTSYRFAGFGLRFIGYLKWRKRISGWRQLSLYRFKRISFLNFRTGLYIPWTMQWMDSHYDPLYGPTWWTGQPLGQPWPIEYWHCLSGWRSQLNSHGPVIINQTQKMAIVMWSFNAVERSLKFLCRFSGVLWGTSPMQTLEFLLIKEILRGPVDMVNVLISSNIHEYRIMFNKYFNSFYIYTRTLCFSLYISSSPDVLYQ